MRPILRHYQDGTISSASPARWAVSILAVAIVARIGAVWATGTGFHFADEAIYVDTARQLSRGSGFGVEYQQVPGYPVFLMLLSLGLSAPPVFLRGAQAVVAAFGTLLVFALADRMFGRRPAIAAGLFYALDPLMVISSALLYPEPSAAVLLTAIVIIATKAADRDEVWRSALTGGLLGLLAQFRPVALIVPPVVGGWIALTSTSGPGRRAAHLGALAVAFLLVLAPWTARSYRIHGQLLAPGAAAADAGPVTREEVAQRGLAVSMTRWALRDPAALLSRVGQQFVQFWELVPTRMTTDDPVERARLHQGDSRLPVQPLFSRRLRDLVSAGSFSLELFLALVGVIVVGRTRWRNALLLVAVIMTYAVGYALFVAKLRYRIPVLPLLFLFTGVGAAAVLQFIGRAVGRSR